MTVSTLGLAILLTVAIYAVRAHWRRVRPAWGLARWYERVALVVSLAPIPGPFDELLGVLVVRRVLARGRS